MKKILIFSPYALWANHTIYEETMVRACRAKGAAVAYLLCDGLLPECDQHWDSKSTAPRPPDLCQRCKLKSKRNLDDLGLPYRWIGDFVRPEEKAKALEWSQGVSPVEMRKALFEGTPLGEWVLSSVISYFRQYPPDMNNPRVVKVYRGFLFSAAIVAMGIRNYLAVNAIDSALLFNGRQSITRVALEIFRQQNIRVLTHERGEFQRGHLNVRPNAHCMNLQPFHDSWREWSSVPLNRESLDSTLKWLVQRRYGANLAWIPFNTSFMRDRSLRKTMNLSRHKRLWALFTSSTDEVAGDPLWQGPYDSQQAWVDDVVQWVARRDDVELVIKVHPNLGGNTYIGRAVDELRIYQQMKASLPANVRIVLPEDSVNVYALADEADLGLTFGSTIGLEMAMLGKPILLASRALYEHGSHIVTIRDKKSLPELLEKCLQATTNRMIQREAFRLAHRYLATEIPFPAVDVLGVFEARLNEKYRDDAALSKDASLNSIAGFLTKGSPVFPAPSEKERQRTTADEDAFFDRLASSPRSLRNARYERWLKLKAMGRFITDLLRRLPFGVGNALLGLGRQRWHALLTWVESKA